MNANEEKNLRRQRIRKQRRRRRLLLLGAVLIIVSGVVIGYLLTRDGPSPFPEASSSPSSPVSEAANRIDPASIQIPGWIDQQFIDVDGAARRGKPLTEVKDLAIHYVANPGTTAQQNRNYFNNPGVEVSSHFLIGLEGEIIQCVPLGEVSSATNDRNIDTISIEVCHPKEDGKFNDKTYASLVKLSAWLCRQFGLDETHLIRHYDVTGKACPLYYVEHPDAWEAYKRDVTAAIKAI